jgi:DNA-binding transcriptional regulator YbjK
MSAARTLNPSSRPRGAARREALLEAALKITAEVGADAVTHRRVAEVAGLPLASTTYWFESKEHLLTAALELAAERDIARLQEFGADAGSAAAGSAAAGANAGSADADPITLAVDAILDPLDERLAGTRGSLIANYALMLEAARRPTLQSVTRRWTEAYLDVVSRLLELAGSDDPHTDAGLLIAAADGLLIEQLASGTSGDLGPRLCRLARALVGAPR